MRSHRRRLLAAVIAATVLVPGAAAHAQQSSTCPWIGSSKTPEQRADQLIAAMTLDQKLAETTWSDPPWFTYWGVSGHVDAVPALCIPAIVMSDAGSGVVNFNEGATLFPSGIAQTATWDPSLSRKFGEALGQEAFAKGINVMLGPGMDMARLAINGRNFEYGGEDPYLTGQAMSAAIRGIQSNPVLAEAKHYVLNDQETNRDTIDARVADRPLHEIYLAPFEAAVKQGHVASIMCSYNVAFGKHACENGDLLNGILRKQWGWDGFVTSDWGATHSTAPSANAGLDLEMNLGVGGAASHYYGTALGDAITAGQVSMATLDSMLRHIFVPMFRYGLFDHPPVSQPYAYANQVDTPAHRAVAREISEQSTVLLKNSGDLLPIDKGTGRTIAVIGNAAGPQGADGASGGGGSASKTGEPFAVSPLEGITRLAATHDDKVLYSAATTSQDAAAVAGQADVAVVFISDSEAEGSDRSTLDAGGSSSENDLVTPVAAANPNTVVVIDAGAPVSMPWLKDVKSVLDAWYPGTENGNAIADLLYGVANPSGHLPQTFPKSLTDMPTKTPEQYPGVNGIVNYTEGLEIGYRYFDAHNVEPLFPFGFGLSYTTFRFADLHVVPQPDGTAIARFKLTNTGSRAGSEVGQVYLGFPHADGEPPHQLKGYKKVFLEPGETQTVSVPLDRRSFAHWDSARSQWAVTGGQYTVSVGSSSRDLPLQGVVKVPGGVTP